ncbi:MAG: homoserine dehydrogenase [Raineya sp.]|jgi:homoserine dehydrogenase|nr:homoserine dehydrogenase [Raineya sp.]
MSRKTLNIGLFGFGCVGYGLYQVLEQTKGLKANVKTICVKNKDKKRQIAEEYFTYDKNDILNDPSINVVVELIDDADAAFEIVKEALQKKKAVVTANKKMIAEHFTELLELQRKYEVPLLYEGACCASIPIIRNLEEYYDNDLLESFEGIVNGSTNYILTQTAVKNISYAEALKEAQEKGYAESDPTLDTGGFDAKYKLLILIAHAFGIVVKPWEIFNLGIDNISDVELAYAREKNLKIKLVAQAFKNAKGEVSCFVIPKFVDAQSRLYNVDDVYNGVITKTTFADTHFFLGKGAGAYPTASAVLSDISALTYDYKYEYKKLNQEEELHLNQNVLLKVLLRHRKEDVGIYTVYFEDISESYLNHHSGFIIGTISLDNLKAISGKPYLKHSVILFEPVPEGKKISEPLSLAALS